MSDGNRHHVIAYLGIGVAFGFAIGAATLGPENQQPTYSEQSESGEPAKSAEQWAAETCAVADQSNSPATEKQIERDLCAQFRAAAAAERSAVFAQEQSRIGWYSLAGLIVATGVAVMAWLAARSSAKADNEALKLTKTQLNEARASADVQSAQMERYIWAAQDQARGAWRAASATREVGQAQMRAYLSIGTPRAPPQGQRIFTFSILNSGLSPARKLRWEYRLTMWKSKDKMAGGTSLTTDPTRIHSTAEIPGGGRPQEMAILESEAPWLRAAIDKCSRDRPATFHVIFRYQDVFNRYFELNERIEISSRTGNELHELDLTHVQSDERQITEAEYNEPIQLPEE